MRIVVDAADLSPVRGKSRGIYSYVRQLVEAMVPRLPETVSLCFLCNGDSLADFAHLRSRRVSVVAVYTGYPSVPQRVHWCLSAGAWAVRRLGADVYFSPKGFAPLGLRTIGRVRTVAVTVHDLIPLWYARHSPHSVGLLERLFINSWLVRSARSADRVIAISQATADALRDELGRSDCVAVIRHGVPSLPPAARAVARDCIFAITSPLAHKNLGGVLAAYARYRTLVAVPLPLVLCGVLGEHGEGVSSVADVTPQALAELYARARVFLFLPLIEGFGFPVVEAAQHGAAVVCSDIPSLREATAGVATFVPPGDAGACARALVRCIDADHGQADAEPHDVPRLPPAQADAGWARCAEATLSVLTRSPDRPGRAARRFPADPAP